MSTTENSKKPNKKPKKKVSKKKISAIVVGIIIVVIIILLCGSYFFVNSFLSKIHRVTINNNELGISQKAELNSLDNKGVHNIYLFGVDEPEGVPGRSDAIMIMSVNDTKHTLKLVSILRDSYVPIPGHTAQKVNAAYAFGGPQLAMETLNKDYGLDIHNFISCNFTSLPAIINILGGTQVDLTPEEVYEIKFPYDQLKTLDHEPNAPNITHAGPQTLDGLQTMAYLRIRHKTGGDYARTYRQRQVIEQLFHRVKNISLTEYPELLSKVAPALETNMSNSEIWQFGEDILATGSDSIQEARVPVDSNCSSKTVNGIWYLVFNQAETNQNLHNFLYGDVKLPNQEFLSSNNA